MDFFGNRKKPEKVEFNPDVEIEEWRLREAGEDVKMLHNTFVMKRRKEESDRQNEKAHLALEKIKTMLEEKK